MSDNFDFKLIGAGEEADFGGYNSARDKTSLRPGMLIRGSKNVYKKVSGAIATRPGLKRRGTLDSTEAGVKSSFSWKTSFGATRTLRVANSKLEVEYEIGGVKTWYELFATGALTTSLAATLTRFVFDTWWHPDEKKDRLLAVRGDDKILHWSGGIAVLDEATGDGDATEDSSADAGNQLSNWSFNGVTTANSDFYTLYYELVVTSGTARVRIYRTGIHSSGSGVPPEDSYMVAEGTRNLTSLGAGQLDLIEVNSSGLSGRVDVIAAAVSDTDTSTNILYTAKLIKQGTETWKEAGFATQISGEKKVVINGTEYTYTGNAESTSLFLTGDVPSAFASLASGDIAIQPVIIQDNAPADGYETDFLKVVNNQVLVGSYTSREIYISADIADSGGSVPLDFSNTGSYVYGDPDKIYLDSPARGIGVRNGKVIIFAGDSDLYVVTLNVNVTYTYTGSDGGGRFIYQDVKKQKLPGLNAALGHEFIDNFGSELVWLDQNNQLRALGTFTEQGEAKPTLLSLPVFEELKEDDFTGGHLRAVEDTIYITAPNTGRDWMYSIREVLNEDGSISSEKIWQPPQVRGISRFDVIDGVLYGHSNKNPQIYQVWDTEQWFDDDPSGEEVGYACVARFAYRNHGSRFKIKQFNKIYFEGYMIEGVLLNCLVYSEYQGFESIQNVYINAADDPESEGDPAKFYAGNPYSLGDSPLGDNPLGQGILEESSSQELIPKFRAITQINPVNAFEYLLEVYSAVSNARWELLVLGPNVVEAEQLPINLTK